VLWRGRNDSGQCGLGLGSADHVTVQTAVVAAQGVVYKRAVTGTYSTLLLDSAGAAWACGGDGYGDDYGYGAFEAEVGNRLHTPTLLLGLAGHGAVVGAAIGSFCRAAQRTLPVGRTRGVRGPVKDECHNCGSDSAGTFGCSSS
jgi:hypothetical protein